MKKKSSIVFLASALLMIFAIFPVAAQEYQLAPGDVLEISVWGYEDLHVKEIAVRPDGRIAFPLAGEVQAAGLSPAALNQAITGLLSNYVRNPIVTVNIMKYGTTRVYVLGEISKPGMYELEKQHNLLDAIGIAGGYTKYAAKRKVYVIRQEQAAVGTKIKVNLLDLLKKGDMSQNIALNTGDIVYLTDSGKLDFARDILPLVSAAYQVTEMQDNN